MRIPQLLLAGIALAWMPAQAGTVAGREFAGVPPHLAQPLRGALELAGENAPNLEWVLDTLPPAQRGGAAFLIASMPAADLVTISPEMLYEDVRAAYEARSRFPWASHYSEDVFFHYVLPYRVGGERLQSWRRFFLDSLAPRLEGLHTLDEEALEVNKWASERVTYKYTQARDQAPLETLKIGYGRCGEEVVFYVDACRAAGVPARTTWTPWWVTQDDNHAWGEVLGEDGKWHYTGACEYRPTLDDGWFTNPARRAGLVLARMYGVPDRPSAPYRVSEQAGSRYTVWNVTERYRTVGQVEAEVVDADGRPRVGVKAFASVFNYGAMRALAWVITDESGVAHFTLGAGDYLLTAGSGELNAWCLASVRTGEMGAVRLALGATSPPQGWHHLSYPQEGSE